MKLEFISIKVKNFLSVGSQPLEFHFKNGIHLVTGKINGKSVRNGCGKSLLFIDSIIFALYGKSNRNVNVDQMVNSIVGEKCEVTLTLKINGVLYRIDRGIKPTYLQIYKEDSKEPIELGSKIETQKKFERILGISYLSFKNMITQNINSSKPFFEMKPVERRQFLEDIVNVSIYGKIHELVKQDFNESKNNKRVLETEFMSAKKLFQDKLETYKKLEDKRKEFEDDKQQTITEYKNKIDSITTQLNNIKISSKDYEKEIDDLNNKLQNLISDRAKYTQILSSNNDSITKKKKQIEKITEFPLCPICGTPTDSDHPKKHIDELENEINELEIKSIEATELLSSIKEHIKTYTISINKLKEKLKEKNDNLHIKNRLETDFNTYSKKLDDIQLKQFDLCNVITKDDVLVLKKHATIKKKELDDETTSMLYASRLKEIFGDKGIKNYIIKKIVPLLNKILNEYLVFLNATFTIKFDDELNETLRSRNCQTFNYNSFSSGEKKRIDIALIFTMLYIAKSRSSIDCNLLVLDEVLDTSLCTDGTESFMSFLKNNFKSMYKNLCTYVITHKSDITEDYFDSVIELEKVNEFTKISNIKKL